MTTEIEADSERLALSRSRMRAWMQDKSESGHADAAPRSALPLAARIVERAGNEALRDTADRHPIALVGVAMAGGALLAWARPWRGLLGSALFAGLASQLGARLVSQIPLASVFEVIEGLAQAPAAARRGPATAPIQEGLRHSG